MTEATAALLRELASSHRLEEKQYAQLVRGFDQEAAALAARLAVAARRPHYGDKVFIRGLIEIGNVCRNDCLYCGIRRSNRHCSRYRLTEEQILACCREGWALGFRTFVLQGGEGLPAEQACALVRSIKREFPGCAVTLSLGEYPTEDYRAMREAGADRYLLRHETADREHYQKLHPPELSFDNRMRCLGDLKDLGFQTGCGFMVGSPYQTPETLGKDLKFVEEFQPAMCGIGPFIPHRDTPFREFPAGSVELTLYLLSLLRLIKPDLLLPATTALGTLQEDGRERGMLAGANVVMPNLSPPDAAEKYTLYDGKLFQGAESARHLEDLKGRMAAIGCQVVVDRGDPAP